ncbi:MAG: gamma-glutamyl-gamma-aminobutyrate hydrolase family protein [Dehalococcoidia bacterium]
MPLIAVTATGPNEAAEYAAPLERRGAQTRAALPKAFTSVDETMEGVSGLLLGGGYDIDPKYYGEEPDPAARVESWAARDEMEFALLRYALERHMPVLGICRGMQVINVAFGGKLIQDLPGHGPGRMSEDDDKPVIHQVYVSPGSKLGAIIGAGAIYRTNSLHHQGVKERVRAPGLMAAAYHPEDGLVEALESPAHPFMMAVQCHPEREDEVPRSFLRLFEWLIGWSERYEVGDMG